MRMTQKGIVSIILCHVLLCLAPFAPCAYSMEDGIIAVVNDDIITVKDLKDYLHTIYTQLRMEGRSQSQIEAIMQEMEKQGIDKLIEDKLLLSEAKRVGIEVREDLIDEKVDEIKQRYPSEQVFLNALLQDGATVTDLRNKINDQLKVKFIIEHEIKSKIFVNPQEVTDYYKNHFEEFQKGERVDLDSIFIAVKDGDKKAAIETTDQALAEINAGTEFADVAKKYSKAPSLGIIEKGKLVPAIEDKVFELKEGEVSGPVATEEGIFIFKIKKKLAPEVTPLENVKESVYNYLFQQKFRDQLQDWIARLKKDAYIEIKQ